MDTVKYAHPSAELGLCGGCDKCNNNGLHDPHYADAVEGARRELRETLAEETAVTERIRDMDLDGFTVAVMDVFDKAEDLLLAKHRNYGPKNISRSPGGALNGLRVRMHDKIARLNHMIDNGVEDAVGEALEETLMDLANYALIGVLVLRGEWPDE